MFRIDVPTAAGIVPAPAAVGTPGYFTNGNPATSTPSTVVDQDWLNAVQEELVNVATAAGAALDKTLRNQVLTAIQKLLQNQPSNFVVDSGSGDAYVGVFTPEITAHVNGMQVRLFIATGNTGAATLNAGPGAKNVLRLDGSALADGDIPANSFATFTYRAANDSWYLSSTSQSFSALTVQQQLGNYVAAAGTNTITATFAPAVTAHVAGMPLRVKIANTNTGAVTFNPNGVGAVAVVNPAGGALVDGDLVAGAIVEFRYDGTNYQYANYRAQIATATEMETATDNTKIVPPGLLHRHPGVFKGWVSFSVAAAIISSYNVTSITDVGVAKWAIVWATDFSSATYTCLTGSESTANNEVAVDTLSAGGVNVKMYRSDDTNSAETAHTASHVGGVGDQ